MGHVPVYALGVTATMPLDPQYFMRYERIRGKWMPNGDIRIFQNTKDKCGVSEFRINHQNNIAFTLLSGNVLNVILEYESN